VYSDMYSDTHSDRVLRHTQTGLGLRTSEHRQAFRHTQTGIETSHPSLESGIVSIPLTCGGAGHLHVDGLRHATDMGGRDFFREEDYLPVLCHCLTSRGEWEVSPAELLLIVGTRWDGTKGAPWRTRRRTNC
jgi:hypothetical protein